MALIEMIPPEYWAKMRQELNALDPSELANLAADENTAATSTACMKRRETPAERSARIAAEYDAAITRRQAQMKLEAAAARRLTPEYQETQRRAAERREERREAERATNPPKPPGRPRAPTDGLTPEQIAKRDFNRERSAQYRAKVKEAERLAKERYRNAQEAPQSHADTSAAQSPTNEDKSPQRAKANKITPKKSNEKAI